MKSILIAFATAVAITLAVGSIQDGAMIHKHIWYMHAYFLALAIGIHVLLSYGLKNNQDQAYLFYMGGMFLRLLGSIGLLALYIWSTNETRAELVIGVVNFLLLYLLYALVEIKSFLSTLRPNS